MFEEDPHMFTNLSWKSFFMCLFFSLNLILLILFK